MNQPEEIFFRSSLGKVIYLIERWAKDMKAQNAAMSGKVPEVEKTAHSFKELLRGI